MMVSNCNGERSLSKMKIIKNRLRTTMKHGRLTYLSLLNVESDLLQEMDLRERIINFASKNHVMCLLLKYKLFNCPVPIDDQELINNKNLFINRENKNLYNLLKQRSTNNLPCIGTVCTNCRCHQQWRLLRGGNGGSASPNKIK
jgi:hypothetical protein